MAKVDDRIKELQAARKSTTCSALKGALGELGFMVNKGTKGNHHTFTHPGLSGFLGGSFDGGHGKNPLVLVPYIQRVIKILTDWRSELIEWEQNHG